MFFFLPPPSPGLSLLDISVAPRPRRSLSSTRLSISTRDAQHPAWLPAWIDRRCIAITIFRRFDVDTIEAPDRHPPALAPPGTARTARGRGADRRARRGRGRERPRRVHARANKEGGYYFRPPFHGSDPAPEPAYARSLRDVGRKLLALLRRCARARAGAFSGLVPNLVMLSPESLATPCDRVFRRAPKVSRAASKRALLL